MVGGVGRVVLGCGGIGGAWCWDMMVLGCGGTYILIVRTVVSLFVPGVIYIYLFIYTLLPLQLYVVSRRLYVCVCVCVCLCMFFFLYHKPFV